jgi:gliding motility-associated-like protein
MLEFNEYVAGSETYEGCSGDGYSVNVNGTTYDENNTAGSETLTTTNGCDSLVMIDLHFHETFSSNYNYAGCEGDGFSISINGSEYNQLNPSGVEVLQSATGCDSTIAVLLEFEPCDTIACAYYVPNVFSANHDNINDAFRFYFSEQCRIVTFEIRIFDRWGALLFESADPAFTWDARYKNKELNPGVFVFVAEIYLEGEAKPILEYGDITLIR